MFGSGYIFRILSPVWYNCAAGIRPRTPPSAKHALVFVAEHVPDTAGFFTYGQGFPRLSVDFEKSPCRSSAVGTRNRVTSLPPVRGSNSCV